MEEAGTSSIRGRGGRDGGCGGVQGDAVAGPSGDIAFSVLIPRINGLAPVPATEGEGDTGGVGGGGGDTGPARSTGHRSGGYF